MELASSWIQIGFFSCREFVVIFGVRFSCSCYAPSLFNASNLSGQAWPKKSLSSEAPRDTLTFCIFNGQNSSSSCRFDEIFRVACLTKKFSELDFGIVLNPFHASWVTLIQRANYFTAMDLFSIGYLKISLLVAELCLSL